MKQPMQALLIAGERMRDDVLSGRKSITIREGHRAYRCGKVMIGCPYLNWVKMHRIIAVTRTTLQEVSAADLEADGFANMAEALTALREWYPDILPQSDVTVVRWS